MRPGEKKTGRPASYEQHEEMVHVSFRADKETIDALETITAAAAASGVVAPRSVALRRAVIAEAKRIKGEST